MIGAVIRYFREKKTVLLLGLLALEGILLFFQWTIAVNIENESLQLFETKEVLFSESHEYSYKQGILACYEAESTEFNHELPQNIEKASDATAFIGGCLKSSGITAELAEARHGAGDIVITVSGESSYTDLLGLLGNLSVAAHTAKVNELTVEGCGEQWVRFVVKINFVLTATDNDVG